MTYSLTWLPGALRDAGLEVLEHDGWQTRGHGDIGRVQGALCHHTCAGPYLRGPLCNLGLGPLRQGLSDRSRQGRAAG